MTMTLTDDNPFGDYVRLILGERARQVPAWLYVQDQGDGVVSFVGGSRTDAPDHPLRYGSRRTHQFLLGDLIVRPRLAVATDTLRGQGLAALVTHDHDVGRMLRRGETLFAHRR